MLNYYAVAIASGVIVSICGNKRRTTDSELKSLFIPRFLGSHSWNRICDSSVCTACGTTAKYEEESL